MLLRITQVLLEPLEHPQVLKVLQSFSRINPIFLLCQAVWLLLPVTSWQHPSTRHLSSSLHLWVQYSLLLVAIVHHSQVTQQLARLPRTQKNLYLQIAALYATLAFYTSFPFLALSLFTSLSLPLSYTLLIALPISISSCFLVYQTVRANSRFVIFPPLISALLLVVFFEIYDNTEILLNEESKIWRQRWSFMLKSERILVCLGVAGALYVIQKVGKFIDDSLAFHEKVLQLLQENHQNMMQVARGTAEMLADFVDEERKVRENLSFKSQFGIDKDRFEKSCVSAVLAAQSYAAQPNQGIAQDLKRYFPKIFGTLRPEAITSGHCKVGEKNKAVSFNPFYALFVHNGVLYITVRGSYTLGDWLADFKYIRKMDKYTYGHVHSGFAYYAQSIFEHLKTQHIFYQPFDRIQISGHSLGGAVATLLSSLIISELKWAKPLDLDTFGAPWCGTQDFVRGYPHLVRSVHWVREKDPVPSVFACDWNAILGAAQPYVDKVFPYVETAIASIVPYGWIAVAGTEMIKKASLELLKIPAYAPVGSMAYVRSNTFTIISSKSQDEQMSRLKIAPSNLMRMVKDQKWNDHFITHYEQSLLAIYNQNRELVLGPTLKGYIDSYKESIIELNNPTEFEVPNEEILYDTQIINHLFQHLQKLKNAPSTVQHALSCTNLLQALFESDDTKSLLLAEAKKPNNQLLLEEKRGITIFSKILQTIKK